VDFDVIDQLRNIYFVFVRKFEYNGTVHQLLTDFEKTYDRVRRKVLYVIFIEYVIPVKLVRLIKICLNEPVVNSTYVKICLVHFVFKVV
jgi:hypothetical protein